MEVNKQNKYNMIIFATLIILTGVIFSFLGFKIYLFIANQIRFLDLSIVALLLVAINVWTYKHLNLGMQDESDEERKNGEHDTHDSYKEN